MKKRKFAVEPRDGTVTQLLECGSRKTECSHGRPREREISETCGLHNCRHCPNLSFLDVGHCSELIAFAAVWLAGARLAEDSLQPLRLSTGGAKVGTSHSGDSTDLRPSHVTSPLKAAMQSWRQILLSFCVNLRESAVAGLFENCPKLRHGIFSQKPRCSALKDSKAIFESIFSC